MPVVQVENLPQLPNTTDRIGEKSRRKKYIFRPHEAAHQASLIELNSSLHVYPKIIKLDECHAAFHL